MEPSIRRQVLDRTRGIIRTNLPVITGWLDERPDLFSYHPPAAGAICYVRYNLDINSIDLAERLKSEKSVLVVPGDHFGMDYYLRLGFGNPATELELGLDRIANLIDCLLYTSHAANETT